MDSTDLVRQILKSPEGQRMKWMVTNGFYDRSRLGLWLFEVIGREYDQMADWSRNIRYEFFPQTCTWSISIWEWMYGISTVETLPPALRRDRILSKKLQKPPINPTRIEAILEALTDSKVTVTEHIAPYTFQVEVLEKDGYPYDYRAVLKTLQEIKPSHLSFRYKSRIVAEYTVIDCSAGAASEVFREYIIETHPIAETAVSHDGGVASDYLKEAHTDNG